MSIARICLILASCISLAEAPAQGADTRRIASGVLRLLKARCVKCHGPAKHESELDLSTPNGLARGGENGPIIVAGKLDKSLLWERVNADEMPPDKPLSTKEKKILQTWISTGAIGLPKVVSKDKSGADHRAYRHLTPQVIPTVREKSRIRTPIDSFIQSTLEKNRLSLSREADRLKLIRRLSFTITGLPPSPKEITDFLADRSPKAYEHLVDRYLASPHYGERWGKFWMDAAGYADSNGYFGADTDRPLAYRYRDYVIRSFNRDKPFDQFVREQLAGDELSGFIPGMTASPEIIELLVATHFLRNGQDGTDSSDGNPDELRVDRYAALESAMQVVSSSLLGITVQCAKCHDHKFEPFTQQDYYQFQSVFYPAFNVKKWVNPKQRFVYANMPGELKRWESRKKKLEVEIAAIRQDFSDWLSENRPSGTVLFRDDFENEQLLAANWSNTAPGDDTPSGKVAVNVDSAQAPGALRKDGVLQVIEGGARGDRWLSTKQSFDWTPQNEGEWIQVTFDLVDNKVRANESPAMRIAFLVALHDFDDNSTTPQGNILLDGNPAGGAAVYVDYPGPDSKSRGQIGKAGYTPGRNYGVRITNAGGGKFWLEHLADWLPEEKKVTLTADDLPDGGFGFEYCCGRSFVVDNVVVESSGADGGTSVKKKVKEFHEQYKARRKKFEEAVKSRNAQRSPKPGKIAWVSDLSANPPDVYLLTRGNYSAPERKVEPAPVAFLADPGESFQVTVPFDGAKSSGRRLAWAKWVTRKGSRPAALMARVQVNRIWQKTFGTGIVATPDNLGVSGAVPSHPELLDWLAAELVRSGWKMKAVQRLILKSAVFRQDSDLQKTAYKVDPENRLLWRFPVRRLDAESIRDAMLSISGQLDRTMGGPYIPTNRTAAGEVVVSDSAPGATRRSVYLYSRRTQVASILRVFDAPSIVFNCVRRTPSTTPLQSLSLLNSDFSIKCARNFSARLDRDASSDEEKRITHAFILVFGRKPNAEEITLSQKFVKSQLDEYRGRPHASSQAWADFCQMLLASNGFLYVE